MCGTRFIRETYLVEIRMYWGEIMNRLIELYARFFIRNGWKKANWYKKHRVFFSQGDNCYLPIYVPTRESYMISMGDNVWITNGARLINHDASVEMIKRATGLGWVDRVGKIKIGNNVFIGNQCIILPNITIGSNVIIGAGSVITKDVPSNSVVAGNPARIISNFEVYTKKIYEESKMYPWDENTSDNKKRMKRIDFLWESTLE